MIPDQPPEIIVIAYPEKKTCDIRHRPVREFCAYCRSVKRPSKFADWADFDAFSLRPWLGYIIILEHLPAEDDFRYRMYGTRIAEYSGFDMTGRLVSDFNSPVGTFLTDLYHDCIAERALIYSKHSRVHARYDCDWHRLTCPVRAGDAIQIVVCNYPVARQKPRSLDI